MFCTPLAPVLPGRQGELSSLDSCSRCGLPAARTVLGPQPTRCWLHTLDYCFEGRPVKLRRISSSFSCSWLWFRAEDTRGAYRGLTLVPSPYQYFDILSLVDLLLLLLLHGLLCAPTSFVYVSSLKGEAQPHEANVMKNTSGGCSHLLGRCFPVSGIPRRVHCFLCSSLHERACPSLRSHHVQGAAARSIADNIWAIGTPMAFQAALFSSPVPTSLPLHVCSIMMCTPVLVSNVA